jgi:two-component system, cell cycle sensor histidine kinase and response regulator CckA
MWTEQRLHELLSTVAAVVSEWDVEERRFAYISGATEVVTGYPASAFFDEPRFWSDRIHPDDRGRVFELYDEAVRNGGTYEFDYRFRSSDDRTRWMRGSAHVVIDDTGRAKSVRTVTIDVTETRRAIAAAERSRSLLAATLESTADGILVVDHRGRVTAANRRFAEMWGLPHEIVEAQDTQELLVAIAGQFAHPERVLARAKGWYSDPERETFDVLELPDGRVFEHYSAPQRLDDKIVGRVLCFHDVTERHLAHEALREREEHFRSLIEQAADVICVLTPDGTSLYESPSVARVLGWAPEELIGRENFSLQHPDDAERVGAYFTRILAGEEMPAIELRLRHKNGSWRTVESTARVRGQNGERVVIVNYRDITERLELEEQLLHAQRLEAVGRLAGGIAHDFNNLLTAIGGYSEFLLAGFEADDPRRADAAEIARAAERAAALTNQLLAFSRRQVLQPEVLDVGAVVTDLENLLGRLLGVDIELATAAEAGCYVEVDRGQLEQVITNLVVNARDAMPSGGRLSIACHPATDGAQVELVVADTGVGMPAETLAHLFEPFYTTKSKDGGTGLGLATVYGIVAQSSGEITVDSEPGHGATFRVFLPAVPAPVPSEPSSELPAWAIEPAEETILLVEDEDTIRRLVAEVLSRSGYTVLDAPAGDAALELLNAHGDRIDLLLTDIVMPGMSGADLARAATLARPSLRVLFTSGYTSDPEEVLAGVSAAFIGKPFSPQALVAKVREILA